MEVTVRKVIAMLLIQSVPQTMIVLPIKSVLKESANNIKFLTVLPFTAILINIAHLEFAMIKTLVVISNVILAVLMVHVILLQIHVP